jgi:oxygen-independent coproporphyrinogen-3 oxidase
LNGPPPRGGGEEAAGAVAGDGLPAHKSFALRWIKDGRRAGGQAWVMTSLDLLAKYDRRLPRYTSYPTAPHFQADVDHCIYRYWLRSLPAKAPASFYLHVPFCAQLCWYCGCHTSVVHSPAPIADYARLLEDEIALVAREAGHLSARHVHWGGGTPNILTEGGLGRIMAALDRRFPVAPDAEIAIELDPRLLSAAQAKELAAAGINRASLGVQDFDQAVQQAVNRIQPYEMTAQAVAWLRGAGIAGLNFDLIYGLPHQTVESVVETTERAATLGPDRIALFGYAHVPWMKKHQRLIDEAALPGPAERLAQADAAAARLLALGYMRVGLDHFARADDPLARRLAAGRLHRNFQGYTTDEAETLIGLGVSAIGSLPQGYVQNTPDITLYRDRIRNGRLATVRGRRLDAEDRLRRDVIERLMCDLEVDLAAAARRHGFAPEIFAAERPALDALSADGIAHREGGRLVVNEHERALVRAVCAVFDTYLDPQDIRHSMVV